MAKRQHLIHLHSTSKTGTTSGFTAANLQVGELAMYTPAVASATTIYAFNANKDALAEFKTDAYYQKLIKDKFDEATGITSDNYTPIGTNADASGTTSYYGVKKYAQQYADAKINGLDSTVTAPTGTVITGITQTNGKLASVAPAPVTFKKTTGTTGDEYVLKIGGVQIGDKIVTYKDSALKNVQLSGQTLVFTYILHDGTEKTEKVNLSDFLTEKEAEGLAGEGLTASGNTLNIVKEQGSEDFLSIGANTIGIKGVQSAIDGAVGTHAAISGTSTLLGHVKLLAGDLSGKTGTTATAGEAAASQHTHSQYMPKSQNISLTLKGGVTGTITSAVTSSTIEINTTVTNDSHTHTSTGITGTISASGDVTSTQTNLVQGKAVYAYVENRLAATAYQDPLTGTTTGGSGTYVTVKHSVNNNKQLTTTIDDSAITTALNGKLANSHAEVSATTGTSDNFGHVSLKSGDLSGVTKATNGVAAASYHTHSQYATKGHTHGELKIEGDVKGTASILSGGTTIQTTVPELANKLSSVSIYGKFGVETGGIDFKTYEATPTATTFDLTSISIDCGEY